MTEHGTEDTSGHQDEQPPEGKAEGSWLDGAGLWLAPALAATLLIIAVAWQRPDRSRTELPEASPACTGQACSNAGQATGEIVRLPERERFLRETGSASANVAVEWHLNDAVEPLVIRADTPFADFTLFAACVGQGGLTVAVDSRDDIDTSVTIACDGIIGPGVGLVSSYDGKPLTSPPYTFQPTVKGDVTDAVFYVIGSAKSA
ncbi:hypothetical protein [Catellatospora sichuanensis]|uniref:hypothetical protein n=1 Tax=Catellatospora sichuanensis TaxID=1969805 RepID=UPI001182F38F|nr:hypothetical protein [Catellatospora sichuanensis]